MKTSNTRSAQGIIQILQNIASIKHPAEFPLDNAALDISPCSLYNTTKKRPLGRV